MAELQTVTIKNTSPINGTSANSEPATPSSRSSSCASLDDGVPAGHVTPPDGGWGWVVVFASFMVNLIADGVSLSFGLLFVDLVDYFEASKSKTAWVGSIFLSMPLLTGPIASYLTDRHGCRIVSIVGGLLAATGFIISYFANSLEILFLTFTISGFGLALCYVASIVIVAYYFEKRRSLATGLAVCGTGIGTFVFAPLTIYLLEKFTWRGTMLILAGLFLNMVVFGSLMRDVEDSVPGSKHADSSHESEEAHASNEDLEGVGGNMRLCSSLVQLPTYMNNSNIPVEVITELSNKEGGYLNTLLEQYPNLLTTFLLSSNDCNLTIKSTPPLSYLKGSQLSNNIQNSNRTSKQPSRSPNQSRKSSIWRGKPNLLGGMGLQEDSAYLKNMRLQRGSITYRGAMLNIRRYRLRASSCPDIYRNSMVTIVESSKVCPLLRDLKDIMLDVVDLRIFKNIQYSIFCVSNFLLYAFVDVPYVYLPDNAIVMGIDKESASFLISILGILNTAGVIIVGYVGDKTWMKSSLLYSSFIILSGIVMGAIPLVKDYYSMALLVAIYGFTISANYTLVSVIIVEIISLDYFTNAYGLLLLVQGAASLIGPPLAGWLFDVTESYDLTFYLTGACIFTSGVLMLPINKFAYPDSSASSVSSKEEKNTKKKEKVRFQESRKKNGFLHNHGPLENGFTKSNDEYPTEISKETDSLLCLPLEGLSSTPRAPSPVITVTIEEVATEPPQPEALPNACLVLEC